MEWTNELTKRLGIMFPIVQAPMFGVTTPEMVTAASSVNCLGSLSLGDLDAEQCITTIRNTRKLSNKPFAVNIFTHSIPPITDTLRKKYQKTKVFLEQISLQHDLDVIFPDIDELNISSYHQQIDAIISEGCKILSFTFGNLDSESIQRLKKHEVLLIGTCTSVKEAIILEKSGIDIICVQGIEAGGHRGTFASTKIPQIGGLSLLAQVSDAVNTPLIYAGGIYNAKTLLATKTLGADGFQVGSLLIASKESALKAFEKDRLKQIDEEDIVLTKSFSGRFARGIKNLFIETLDSTEYILPYPYQNKLTGVLRKAAKMQENPNFASIWTGQSIHKFSEDSTGNILTELITATETF